MMVAHPENCPSVRYWLLREMKSTDKGIGTEGRESGLNEVEERYENLKGI